MTAPTPPVALKACDPTLPARLRESARHAQEGNWAHQTAERLNEAADALEAVATPDAAAMRSALEAQMEAQANDDLPSSVQRDRGRVWLEGWFDLEAALSAPTEAGIGAGEGEVPSTAAIVETYWQMHETAKELGYPSILEALEATPTPKPPAALDEHRAREVDDLHDVITHRSAWREALDQLKALTGDDNGTGYWSHEIRAFDRTFDKLAALATFPRAAGDRLREALEAVRADLTNENGLNLHSITDVIWHTEVETTVDFIDDVLALRSVDAEAGA